MVGTVGVRVHRYVWLGKADQIRYREIPPAPEWNSERISRCVSVEVGHSVDVVGAPGDLRDDWSRAGMARVDPRRRRLVRPRTIELKRD